MAIKGKKIYGYFVSVEIVFRVLYIKKIAFLLFVNWLAFEMVLLRKPRGAVNTNTRIKFFDMFCFFPHSDNLFVFFMNCSGIKDSHNRSRLGLISDILFPEQHGQVRWDRQVNGSMD